MSNQTDIYLQKLQLFNLDEEESSVYIYLLKNSFTTALQISRDLKIGRTKVYRILDKLQQSHLAEDKLGERGLEFGKEKFGGWVREVWRLGRGRFVGWGITFFGLFPVRQALG